MRNLKATRADVVLAAAASALARPPLTGKLPVSSDRKSPVTAAREGCTDAAMGPDSTPSHSSYRSQPAYQYQRPPTYHRRTPTPPIPTEVFVALALVSTLALHLLGLSWRAVIFHPILSLHAVADMVTYKIQDLADRFGQARLGLDSGAWDRFGASVRGDDVDDDPGADGTKVVRSYKELRTSAEASESKGAPSTTSDG